MESPLENAGPSPRLVEQARLRVRSLHYSLCTENTSVYWVRLFLLFYRNAMLANAQLQW